MSVKKLLKFKNLFIENFGTSLWGSSSTPKNFSNTIRQILVARVFDVCKSEWDATVSNPLKVIFGVWECFKKFWRENELVELGLKLRCYNNWQIRQGWKHVAEVRDGGRSLERFHEIDFAGCLPRRGMRQHLQTQSYFDTRFRLACLNVRTLNQLAQHPSLATSPNFDHSTQSFSSVSTYCIGSYDCWRPQHVLLPLASLIPKSRWVAFEISVSQFWCHFRRRVLIWNAV